MMSVDLKSQLNQTIYEILITRWTYGDSSQVSIM